MIQEQIENLIETIPMMISKTVDENKMALNHNFKPKLAEATKKLENMEQTLDQEIRQRDNLKEMRTL